jgi:predicted transcriptional regulator of viral defense system
MKATTIYLNRLDYYFNNGTDFTFHSADIKIQTMKLRANLRRIDRLLSAPSFTAREAAELGLPAANLAYYVKRGDLERVAHGVYRAPQAPTTSDFRWEDLVTALQSVKDGVVCLTSALALYGITEEMPRQHWIAIKQSTRHRAGPDIRIVRMSDLSLGRTTLEVGGITVPIFDRERTIVDSFRRLGPEVAVKALRTALAKPEKGKKLDLRKLQQYAKKLRFDITPYLLAVTP